MASKLLASSPALERSQKTAVSPGLRPGGPEWSRGLARSGATVGSPPSVSTVRKRRQPSQRSFLRFSGDVTWPPGVRSMTTEGKGTSPGPTGRVTPGLLPGLSDLEEDRVLRPRTNAGTARACALSRDSRASGWHAGWGQVMDKTTFRGRRSFLPLGSPAGQALGAHLGYEGAFAFDPGRAFWPVSQLPQQDSCAGGSSPASKVSRATLLLRDGWRLPFLLFTRL